MATRDLTYRIGADTQGLSRGMREVEASVRDASKKSSVEIKKLGGALKAATGQLALLAGAAKALSAIKSAAMEQFRAVEQLDRASRALGVTFNDLQTATVAFAGVPMEHIENALGRVAANAQDGETTMQALQRITAEISELGPGVEATQRAFEVFGDDLARKVLPSLLKGSQALADAEERARELGLTIDRDATQAVASLAEQMQEVNLATKGFARQVVAEVAPAIDRYVRSIREATSSAVGYRDAVDAIGVAVKVLLTGFELFTTAITTWGRAIGEIVGAVYEQLITVADGFGGMIRAVLSGDLSAITEAYTTGLRNWGAQAAEGVSRVIAGVEDQIGRGAASIQAIWSDEVIPPFEAYGPSMEQLTRVVDDGTKKVVGSFRSMADGIAGAMTAAMGSVSTALEEAMYEQQEWAGHMAREGPLAVWEHGAAAAQAQLDELAKHWADAGDEMTELFAAAARETQAEWERTARTVRDMGRTAGNEIADVLFGPSKKSMEDLLKSIAEAFARLAIQQAIGAGVGALGFASGGYVSGPGSSTSDSIPARLSDGEYVINARAVDKYGREFFDRLNAMMPQGFAAGGPVSASGGPDIVVVAPPTRDEFDAYLRSTPGKRVVIAAMRDAGWR